jgi:hypothetical protein
MDKKLPDSAKGAIGATAIGAAGTVIAAMLGWVHIGEGTDNLKFPVSLIDNFSKSGIPDAEVNLGIPDLSPTPTDSHGTDSFDLTKQMIGKSANLTVRAKGY